MFEDVDGVVFDLDGTLVELAVDWERVRDDIRGVLENHGIDSSSEDTWELLDRGVAAGHEADIESVLSTHELGGASTSDRLPLADALVELEHPVGVCSLNCEAACRRALETHDLASHVDAVIGRDSVPTRKPAPEPLLTALDEIGVPPEAGVFIGDSESDAVSAARADVPFRSVTEIVDTL